MASLRSGRRSCIRAAFGATGLRAGFQKRQRNAHHRLKVLLLTLSSGCSRVRGSGEGTLPWACPPGKQFSVVPDAVLADLSLVPRSEVFTFLSFGSLSSA